MRAQGPGVAGGGWRFCSLAAEGTIVWVLANGAQQGIVKGELLLERQLAAPHCLGERPLRRQLEGNKLPATGACMG